MKRVIFSLLAILPLLLATGCKETNAVAWWLPSPWQPVSFVPVSTGTDTGMDTGAQVQGAR